MEQGQRDFPATATATATSSLSHDHSGLINPTPPPLPARLIALPGSSEPPLPIPLALLESEEIFASVLSAETWDSLSPESKEKLREFLPVKASASAEAVDAAAKAALDPKAATFFSAPLSKNFKRLKDGWLNAEGPCEARQLRDNARLAYDHMIRRYHIDLLGRLLTSRRKLLEATAAVAVTERPKFPVSPSPQESARSARAEKIRKRSAKRCRMMLSEVSSAAGGDGGLSSDDDDLASAPPKLSIAAVGEPTISTPGANDLQLYQPLEPAELQDMLREHRRLKSSQPEAPVLELSGISMEDVIHRAGMDQMAEKLGLPVKNPTRPHSGASKKPLPSPLPRK